VFLLTFHDHTHILDKTMDDFESLSGGSSSLIPSESVQPLQDRLNVLLSEKFLHKFDCVGLRNILRQQDETHSIVPA